MNLSNNRENSAEFYIKRERKRLAAIEELLDKVSFRELTEGSIRSLEDDLREIIAEIRKWPHETGEKYFHSRKAVLVNLGKASDQLNIALEQFEKKDRKPQFYNDLRTCQMHLEKALKYW